MTSPSAILSNTYYHIYNRGINHENIFMEERNYNLFLQLYSKYIEPVAETFAYCLLRNHFHLLVRIKSQQELGEDLSDGTKFARNVPSVHFSNFFAAYAKTMNSAYRRTGSLFQHPFGRVPITSDWQMWNVIAYIHQNPQKHHFVDDFRQWKYSSYAIILSEEPTHLHRCGVLEWFGGKQQYMDLHQIWVEEAQAKWFVPDDAD